MQKRNCWEYKKCGREAGGNNTAEFGICPASTSRMYDNIHGGTCAGRACWVVAGTMCGGEVLGSFARKYTDCKLCDFYNLVKDEEGDYFLITVDLLKMIMQE